VRKISVFQVVQLLKLLSECELAYRQDKPLIRPNRDQLCQAVCQAAQHLLDLGLVTSANMGTDFILQLKAGQFSDDAIAHAAHTLFKSIMLESHQIVCYQTANTLTFDEKQPLGKNVAEKFPECSEDIREAHECLRFDRYTACAFHVGRAIERAVVRVAKKMKAKPARDQWQSYINAMKAVIEKMPYATPKQKAKRALFCSASDYLFNFKEAWRNPTMHPERTYTCEQASEILSSAASFLRHAADKIL
jgi:hypothetical protein